MTNNAQTVYIVSSVEDIEKIDATIFPNPASYYVDIKFTNVDVWISHGKDNKYVLKRLISAETKLSSMVIEKMKLYGKSFLNKDYDVYFSWNDNEIYCSELVWKIYKNAANFELCQTAKLKSFQLDDPKVKLILKQRYGNAIPLDEAVVAPSQLVESKILKTIVDNY